MCYIIICKYFSKLKIIIFKHFSKIFFKLIQNPPLHPITMKVRGLVFFKEQTWKSGTKDMYHTPLSQLVRAKSPILNKYSPARIGLPMKI